MTGQEPTREARARVVVRQLRKRSGQWVPVWRALADFIEGQAGMLDDPLAHRDEPASSEDAWSLVVAYERVMGRRVRSL